MAIYNINKFYGGISNDDYVGPVASLYDAVNVDLSSSKGVKLSRNFGLTQGTNNVGKTYNEIVGIIPKNNGLIVMGTQDANDINGNQVSDYSSTINSASITGLINTVNGKYGFIVDGGDNGKIYKWSYDKSANDTGLGSDGSNLQAQDTLNTIVDNITYIIQGTILYIAVGNKIFSIDTTDSTWTVSTDILQIDYGYNITFLSIISDQMIIYANNGTHGKQYYWNYNNSLGYDEYPERIINWYNQPILGGYNDNNIDYIITGHTYEKILYKVSGYQRQKITKTDVFIDNTKNSKFFYSFIGIWDNKPGHIIKIQDTIIFPANGNIYKYGNNQIGFPKTFTRDEINDEVALMYYDYETSIFYVLTKTGDLTRYNYIRQPNDGTYSFSLKRYGSIETLKFQGNNLSIKKQTKKIQFGYKLANTDKDNGINIYIRRNNNNYFHNFYIDNTFSSIPSINDVYKVGGINFTVYDITFKYNTDGSINTNQGLILHTKTTDKYKQFKGLGGTLNKVSGSGDDTYDFYKADDGYEKIANISNIHNKETETENTKTVLISRDFNELQVKIDLYTDDETKTPTFYNFILEYDTIKNEL